jgi:hypothetical protein
MIAEFRYKPLPSGRNPDGIFCRQTATEIGGQCFLTRGRPPEGADGTLWPSDQTEMVPDSCLCGLQNLFKFAKELHAGEPWAR